MPLELFTHPVAFYGEGDKHRPRLWYEKTSFSNWSFGLEKSGLGFVTGVGL